MKSLDGFNMGKQIIFLIKVMSGGGAERVVSLLSKAVAQKGMQVSLVLTHQSLSEADLTNVDRRVKVVSLPDEVKTDIDSRLAAKIVMLWARLIGKLPIKDCEEKSSILKYYSRNFKQIKWLKNYFKKNKKATAVAFLYDSIFMTLLSADKSNKVIISERGDPCQSLSSKTTMAFLKTKIKEADDMVFQSPDVKKWYEENIVVSGTVIFNPVKADLPQPYSGERKKRVVNFCRISDQKNLVVLVQAFAKFREEFPNYELEIIGDPVGNGVEGYLQTVEAEISRCKCEDSIRILPSRKNIHETIRDYAMFVSSSDYEGMSNSMLEAMAIGLPCVCTDCPAGGARAVIKDGENGLLVPIKDAEALANAMKRVVSEEGLAQKLSHNAVKIREDQSLEKITGKWMEIING